MPDELWARIVYDFALAHRLRTINREHLLRLKTPLYLGWAAGYAKEMEAADEAAVERRLERLRRLTKSPNHISYPGGDGPTGSTHSRAMREGFVYEGASQASSGSVNDTIHNRVNPARFDTLGPAERKCGTTNLTWSRRICSRRKSDNNLWRANQDEFQGCTHRHP
jgi:hypothetical protein